MERYGYFYMENQFERSAFIIGEEGVEKLQQSHVAVFGVGGVGGYVVEALVRSGIGEITIVDNDTICLSNINRQIIATHDTVGQYKVDVMEKRIKSINPNAIIHSYRSFFLPETAEEFDFASYNYVVDAIDTVAGKLSLVEKAQAVGTPIMCSMGAGNKLDPTKFEVADIYKTSICPLAKVMRYECKKRGIKKLKVVYSKELPITPVMQPQEQTQRRSTPGSIAFVPSAAGLIIASTVVRDLLGK
ncbi:tRNA threonylcarbamoyladenosine dehydratase [Lachnoclostridium phytofermentans]|uniref:UBA/THIF-type NAD/FAD binding protein n=1 Tax=Lachnoclostridium phytofermentans (strain ATCC 700394 / DSM 18823 / ISDg) TaxID=357809 RepID=A9KNT3_LACP7|nr:tRNA threonylcarbamoyladenosine dehydratase [Lachnoclostridium phytofermentans]ABX41684.1 UBA/THIF-type NAD/FAD binding protein [Lachnoclostridium phytofermentans ISDg]